ncbi:toll/interleukin-1 receptor domain-containing protein [Motiliproteus sp. SC1-56]|uniref:toll/interleukin-1 receptor domain-containing protein n=1 Tax=Motiliproteus sp. SC1-56 TaxID=2799565 RepID=UPI001A8E1AEB|nr:toll/interleukin-1 receptor domain-containing protein [Motiliproteus sp. SC1-56]
MSPENNLLTDPFIADWIKSHQGSVKEVQRAAEWLSNKQDAPTALRKLLPALSEKAVNVFFSYKQKDEIAAREVVRLLRLFSANKLRISFGADNTEEIPGQEWRDKIKEDICRANWFILLLPDPSDDWDWCLYETGLFDREVCSCDRVICLHHPDTPIPDPISTYHHVKATVPEVEKFLRMVYVEDNPIPGLPPINPEAEPDIGELAQKIVNAIRPPEKVYHDVFEPSVVIRVANPGALENPDDLDSGVIEYANPCALALFDFVECPGTWGALRAELAEKSDDARWLSELFHVIRRAAQGRRFYPVQAVFKALNGQFYRPVLHAVDRANNSQGAILNFHLTFSEDVVAIDNSSIPRELAKLAAVLRFAYRFRWEVLEGFAGKMASEEDVDRLDVSLRRLNKDWESRDIGDRADIINLFDKAHRDSVFEMFIAWNNAKNPEGTGELNRAMDRRDARACSEILQRFAPMNQEFLGLVVERFWEMIANSKNTDN